MSAARLSDAQWEAIRPHLPARPRMGRPRADDRWLRSSRRVVVRWDRHVGVYRGSSSSRWR